VKIRDVDEEVVPVLYVEDAARAVAWYERLGFQKAWEHQFEPGLRDSCPSYAAP
jgi:catechol 2,3-dioxygenase-like lactoylglutathione lyase family enzyme